MMARWPRGNRTLPLDVPKGQRVPAAPRRSSDRFGRATEWIARAMGTPWFLAILTLICAAWLLWNTFGPVGWRFDSAALGFTALTLVLSLQASYAAPLILLAQNRQDDRDRVSMEQDRQRAERNLADTEYLAREVAALRLAMKELATKDFLRAELRDLLEELALVDDRETPSRAAEAGSARSGSGASRDQAPERPASRRAPAERSATGGGSSASKPDADGR